jgi:hypothetical protein
MPGAQSFPQLLKTRRGYNTIKSEEKGQVFAALVTAYSTALLYLQGFKAYYYTQNSIDGTVQQSA